MSSKRHCREMSYDPMLMGMGGYGGGFGGGGYGGCSYGGLGSGCGFNFSYILILLLIALQFGRRPSFPPVMPTTSCADGVVSDPGIGAGGYGGLGGFGGFGGFGERGLIDNSVLFILAFYLLVCGCCIGGGGCGFGRGCGCGGFGGRFF